MENQQYKITIVFNDFVLSDIKIPELPCIKWLISRESQDFLLYTGKFSEHLLERTLRYARQKMTNLSQQ